MKPYNQYGSEMRRTLRNIYSNHPQPTRVYAKSEHTYEALERDGWVKPIGKRSAMLTPAGVAKLREVMR